MKRLSQVKDEAEFLSQRNSRLNEVLRVFRIAIEFIRGFRAFHFLPPAVTVFGSARFAEDHPYYALARRIGELLAKEGFVVVTGGGPGLMEAANRGAKEAGGYSVGANIILPREQKPNPYLDRFVNFYYFFVRKVILVKYSYAFVILPGGFGTLDELTEALTLIQTGKLYDFPVVLMCKDYWSGFLEWSEKVLVKEKTISPDDLKLIKVTDDPEEALAIIRHASQRLRLPLKKPSDMGLGLRE
ncbi:MAG: TIGR00730 family Rossman fold protein [Bdellovibrionota bacterium]